MLIRCSSLPKIMTEPRNKSEVLSETAKSEIKKMVLADYYGIEPELTNKYVQKGIQCEDTSIELLNSVLFTDYLKHKGRVSNEYLTGECDILSIDESLVIDIKTSWSIETFPMLPSDINPKDYEMQLRGYMMLYNVDSAMLAYCMVDTPEELIGWDNPIIHQVGHIAETERVTMLEFTRDAEIEERIIEKCKHAQNYYVEYINELQSKNK
jgi:hypothetical protein